MYIYYINSVVVGLERVTNPKKEGGRKLEETPRVTDEGEEVKFHTDCKMSSGLSYTLLCSWICIRCYGGELEELQLQS